MPCPCCGSARTEPLNMTPDGRARWNCMECGEVFEVSQ